MGERYHLPANHENLAACKGLYIDCKTFFGNDLITDSEWLKTVESFTQKLKRFIPSLTPVNDWVNSMGIGRYILMQSSHLRLVLNEDGNEQYFPVYLIIPEQCEDVLNAKREFKTVFNKIQNYLVLKYPNAVYKRKNACTLEPLDATSVLTKKARSENEYGYTRKYSCG